LQGPPHRLGGSEYPIRVLGPPEVEGMVARSRWAGSKGCLLLARPNQVVPMEMLEGV